MTTYRIAAPHVSPEAERESDSAISRLDRDAFEPVEDGWMDDVGVAFDNPDGDTQAMVNQALNVLRDTPEAYQPDAESSGAWLFPVHYREFRSGDATLEWTEPDRCTCEYPHSHNLQCMACMLELFAKGRRTWNRQTNRWDWDPNGPVGAYHQSRQVDNFRAHVTKLPNGQWVLIMSEFSHIDHYSFEKRVPVPGRPGRYRLVPVSGQKQCRDILGFKEVFDLEEGEHQANEMVEHWIWAHEHNEGAIVDTYGHHLDTLPPMGAAVVSPEFLEHLEATRGIEVIA